MRFFRIGVLGALALAVSACGGTKEAGSVPASADFAPASSVVYLTGVTDPGSSQWQKAEKLLGRFPGREKLLASARKDLRKDGLTWERDVKPALGADMSLVLLKFENADKNYVFFTKPKDEAKFNKLLEAGDDKQVHRKIDGWTVFSDKKVAIDNFAKAHAAGGDSLAETDEFRDAMKKLPDDAALRGFVSGDTLYTLLQREAATDPDLKSFQNFTQAFGTLKSVSFSASAKDDGVGVEAAYTTSREQKIGSFSPALDDALPSGALFYLSFGNLEDFLNGVLDTANKNFPDFNRQRSQFEDALGFSLRDDLFPLFSEEGAAAIYSGRPIPGIVFMLDVHGKEDKAKNVLRRIGALASLGGGAQSRTFKVGDVEARELSFPSEGFSIFSAVDDGKLIGTSTEKLLRSALGDSDKLADDSTYEDARDAADAPDDTVGFFYANLKTALPWAFDLAESEGDTVPADAKANTKPLQSVFLYAKKDGKRVSLSGFLGIQ